MVHVYHLEEKLISDLTGIAVKLLPDSTHSRSTHTFQQHEMRKFLMGRRG